MYACWPNRASWNINQIGVYVHGGLSILVIIVGTAVGDAKPYNPDSKSGLAPRLRFYALTFLIISSATVLPVWAAPFIKP